MQQDLPRGAKTLGTLRDPMTAEVVDNLLAGYACIDRALALNLDLLTLGSSKHLLELNTLVLCGPSTTVRQRAAEHLVATENHFYGQVGGKASGS